MTDISSTPKLDPNEQHFRFPGPRDGLWQESIGFLLGDDVAPMP